MCLQFADLRSLAGGLKVEEAAGEGGAGGEAGGSCSPHSHRRISVGVVEAGSDEARVRIFRKKGGGRLAGRRQGAGESEAAGREGEGGGPDEAHLLSEGGLWAQ